MPVWDICSGQWCNSEIPIKQNKKGTKHEEFTENLGKSKRTCLTAGAGDRRDPGHCRSVYYSTVIVCVVMKDSLTTFIQTIVTAMQTKAADILTGV